jgi:N-carbamoyl-L-amino-acid hydrolase
MEPHSTVSPVCREAGWPDFGAVALVEPRQSASAGHDACYLARVAPTGMIFVPCESGISHNEIENARKEDLTVGAKVLLRCVAR